MKFGIHQSSWLDTPDPAEAFEAVKVKAPLLNRTALAGSRYPIFVAVEYDEDGAHQTLIASSTVEVQPKRPFSRWIIVGAVVLVVVWAFLLIVRRTKP